MEFKAAGIDEDGSFNELDQFYMKYHLPLIKNEIESAYQQKMALYQEIMQNNMEVTGEPYQVDDTNIF